MIFGALEGKESSWSEGLRISNKKDIMYIHFPIYFKILFLSAFSVLVLLCVTLRNINKIESLPLMKQTYTQIITM